MLTWIIQNFATIVIIGVLIGLMILAILHIRKNIKNGGCIGCKGGCSRCHGCSSNTKNKPDE